MSLTPHQESYKHDPFNSSSKPLQYYLCFPDKKTQAQEKTMVVRCLNLVSLDLDVFAMK